MSDNSFGKVFRITTFGESHGPAIGVVLDGVPPGLKLSEADIQADLDRRRPGQSGVSTPRSEADRAEILSGVFEGLTTGAPVAVLIRNADSDSSQYDNIRGLFRPGHADFTYFMKYGGYDYRGGGRASGRETACRVAAGAVARRLLAHWGVRVRAAAVQVAGVAAQRWVDEEIDRNPVRAPDLDAASRMEKRILEASAAGDSVGGVVECRATGCPAGLGAPLYGKLNAELAYALMTIGAARAVEIGDGVACALRAGSENNDAMDEHGFVTNHTGGILGGISTGEPIIARVHFKPTSSIARAQQTVTQKGERTELAIRGRHDPCIVPRAVPVVEAMTAVVLADHVLRNEASQVLRRRPRA